MRALTVGFALLVGGHASIAFAQNLRASGLTREERAVAERAVELASIEEQETTSTFLMVAGGVLIAGGPVTALGIWGDNFCVWYCGDQTLLYVGMAVAIATGVVLGVPLLAIGIVGRREGRQRRWALDLRATFGGVALEGTF